MNIIKSIKNKLHTIAITRGWYKTITTGLPLNVCKTVFGVHFIEAEYKPTSPEQIMEIMYEWGCYEADNQHR